METPGWSGSILLNRLWKTLPMLTQVPFSQWPQVLMVTSGVVPWRPVGKKRQIKTDKLRDIVKFVPFDLVIARGLTRGLERLQGSFLPCVHSYLPHRDQMTALRSVQRYLRRYRKSTPTLLRNLYVLRVDVKKCGESIYVGEGSLLWRRFRELGVTEDELILLKQGLRPELDDNGVRSNFLYGTPTGSPLQPLALNVYLSTVDRAVYPEVGKGLYVRFGDDILLMHPDAKEFDRLVQLFKSILDELELTPNEKKWQIFQFNGAGRRVEGNLLARDHLEFLGLSVAFHGGLGLTQAKTKKLTSDFRRLCHRLSLVKRTERLEITERAVKRFLASGDPLGHASMDTILRKVDDRIWMKNLRRTFSVHLAKTFRSQLPVDRIWRRLKLPLWEKDRW